MIVAEGYRRLNLIYNNSEYLLLTEAIKNLPEKERKGKHPLKTERAKLKFKLAKEVGLSGSSSMVFSFFITEEINKNLVWAGIHTLGTQVVRKLGDRIAKAFIDCVKQNAQLNKFSIGKPKFLSKRNGKELHSLEACYARDAITFEFKNNKYYVTWSNGQFKKDKVILTLPIFIDKKGKNFTELQALIDASSQVPQKDKKGNIKVDENGEILTKSGLCYTRIVRKIINGKWKYFAQLVIKGKPYSNVKTQDGKRVALDLGPSEYGIVSEQSYKEVREQRKNSLGRAKFVSIKEVSGDYKKFCGNLIAKDKKIAKVPKFIDIVLSQRIQITTPRGNIVHMEKLSIKAWQKMWGKRISFTSPGMFTAKLSIAIKRHGGHLENIDTYSTKLSQLCHVCEKYTKKDTLTKSKKKGSGLSIRRQKCCERNYHRDKYSAYLALFTVNNIVDIIAVRKNEKSFEKALL